MWNKFENIDVTKYEMINNEFVGLLKGFSVSEQQRELRILKLVFKKGYTVNYFLFFYNTFQLFFNRHYYDNSATSCCRIDFLLSTIDNLTPDSLRGTEGF